MSLKISLKDEKTFIILYNIIIIVVLEWFFNYSGLLPTEPDNARYMISTLVQSMAAIFAIIISLSLVAVQLTASSYSTRVIDIFLESRHLHILFSIYSIEIIYGLLLLRLIPPKESMSSFEIYISLLYYLGIISFFLLWYYLKDIMNMIKPSAIINRLCDRITKDQLGSQNDSIQPVMDIMRSSLDRYDYETLASGLKAITTRSKILFERGSYSSKRE